jgi:predicted small integral membrane protein
MADWAAANQGIGLMLPRIVKILLTASAGVLIVLVGLNNIMDYRTNFEVVRHILSMDTIPKDSPLIWRAMTSPALHHMTYWFIILAELIAGGLCLHGALRMKRALRAGGRSFTIAKETAILGLALGFSLYFLGFMAIGGEWFQMWRSEGFNMQEPAFRFIGGVGLVLLLLCQSDGDVDPKKV